MEQCHWETLAAHKLGSLDLPLSRFFNGRDALFQAKGFAVNYRTCEIRGGDPHRSHDHYLLDDQELDQWVTMEPHESGHGFYAYLRPADGRQLSGYRKIAAKAARCMIEAAPEVADSTVELTVPVTDPTDPDDVDEEAVFKVRLAVLATGLPLKPTGTRQFAR